MKIKICGLRQAENIQSLLPLQPDYMGFIFYEKSKRYASENVGRISNPADVKDTKKPIKTGVFVNEALNKIKTIVEKYGLTAVQLHGDESVEFCRKLRMAFHPPPPLKGGQHPAKTEKPYVVEKDTNEKIEKAPNYSYLQKNQATFSLEGSKGVNSSIQIIKVFSVDDDFDFSTTKKYEPVCDLFLFDTKGKERGGNGIAFNWNILNNYIGEKLFFLSGGIGPEDAAEIKKINHPKLFGVDINSRFELEPGLKDVEAVKNFFNEIKN